MDNEQQSRVITIRSPKVAAYLLNKGCRDYLIRIKPDPEKPDKTNFVFERNKEVSAALNEYSQNKPNGANRNESRIY